jgi:SAM-dependent methyltransferase
MDLANIFSAEVAKNHLFGANLKRDLNTLVAEGDGMYAGDGRHYLHVGRSALDCISIGLTHGTKKPDDIRSALDFGCGFGRVTRWLAAAFPCAELMGMDINAQAIAAMENVLKVRGFVLSPDWSNFPVAQFDLIWVGSLFTHISAKKSALLLDRLSKILKPDGILAATTHGRLVVDRIRCRERNYNLSEEASAELLSLYDSDGYGFVPYSAGQDYGISVCRASRFIDMADQVRLRSLVFVSRGWANHQDFFSFSR